MTTQHSDHSGPLLRVATALLIVGILMIGGCGPSDHDDYKIGLSADPQSAARLLVTEEINGKLTSKGLMHAHILSADQLALYHEHPQQRETGKFALDLTEHAAGEYDIWIEITTNEGHANAVLKRFTMNLPGKIASAQDPGAARIALQPVKLALKPAGAVSDLEFLLQLDGSPVAQFGKFIGVEVHAFAVSSDRTWFKHDHAEPKGGGKVTAHFRFPKAGDYVIFLQPTVVVEEGRELRPMLRFKVTVP